MEQFQNKNLYLPNGQSHSKYFIDIYEKKKEKKKFVNTSNIHTTYKFLGEEPCNKMELEINRLLLLLL